ncbi:hypothetical protein GTW73_07555, partial [Streptomyces sp. SID4982]|nr:hypothetical protein [Streptomyces sp. SID4982]
QAAVVGTAGPQPLPAPRVPAQRTASPPSGNPDDGNGGNGSEQTLRIALGGLGGREE